MKVCSKCKNEKPTTDFGHRAVARDGLNSWCKSCQAHASRARTARLSPEERAAKWKAEYARDPESKRELAKEWNRAHPGLVRERNRCARMTRRTTEWAQGFVLSISHRAKRYGLEFDLTIEFLEQLFAKQHGLCHWLGIPMLPSVENRDPRRPSVDRLDNSRGYTQDNVVLTCMFANLGRSAATVQQMRTFVASLRETMQPAAPEGPLGRSYPPCAAESSHPVGCADWSLAARGCPP